MNRILGMKTSNIAFLFFLVFGTITNLFANPSFGNFRSITLAEGLNNNTVYDIIKDQRGFVWLSTDMGISRYDGYHFRNYPLVGKDKPDEKNTYSLPQAVAEMKSDAGELLYLRLLQGGITCFDKAKECYLPIQFDRSFEEKTINSLYVADKQVLYLGTSYGLYGAEIERQNKKENEVVEMQLTETPLVKGGISLLCGDNQGNLFFCLDGNKIVCYSMGTRQKKSINASVNMISTVSKLYVHGDYLWICSKRGEIGCYDYKRDTYRELTDLGSVGQTRLSDTYITDIVAGNSLEYYLSTGAGLFFLKFDSDKLSNASYTIDFIAPDEHSPLENKMTDLIWGQSQNILWIGTLGGGVVRITYDDITNEGQETDRQNNQLILSDLWLGGKSIRAGENVNGRVVLTSSPDRQEEYIFGENHNDFFFYFTDLQYGAGATEIAYRLLPNEAWGTSTLKNGVRFNHLSVGKYTLQVKLIDAESEGRILEIPISVERSWWSTVWAIAIYMLLLGGFIAGLFYFLLQRAKKKMQRAGRNEQSSELVTAAEESIMEGQNEEEIRNVVFARFMQELRTPLSLVISPLREVMQEKELSKGLNTKILVAYRNSIGMLNSCDQLLGVYTYYLKKEKAELAPYNIIKVVDAFVFSMNEFLRVHPIGFQYEKKIGKDVEAWIDKKAIELALQNMLANAFTHVRFSGAVALILQEVVENEIPYCTITVVDNGRSQVKTVEELGGDIQKLSTVDSAEIELGFAVMEDIMKWHHGSITLENLRGGGTKVQLKWPLSKSVFEEDKRIIFIDPEKQDDVILPDLVSVVNTAGQEEEEDESPMDQESVLTDRVRKTILIIEDYKDIRLYLKVFFEKEYNVLLATNGEEGINLARKELPDLIICDIMMPVKDGYECCKELKNGLDTCHIPFVLLTAKVEDDDIIKGLEMGADDYILKPFVAKILKVKVKNLIEGRVNLKKMYTKLLVTPVADNGDNDIQGEKEAEIEDPFISTVVRIIEENILEPDFNVKKLASDLNMSQPTLYRKVKQCTDFTIIELIRGVRMRRAATLLKKKQYPVQEVVEMVGYNDIPTFRKHFVDTYGVTPSTYANSEASDKK